MVSGCHGGGPRPRSVGLARRRPHEDANLMEVCGSDRQRKFSCGTTVAHLRSIIYRIDHGPQSGGSCLPSAA
jgi:hypothetical protein